MPTQANSNGTQIKYLQRTWLLYNQLGTPSFIVETFFKTFWKLQINNIFQLFQKLFTYSNYVIHPLDLKRLIFCRWYNIQGIWAHKTTRFSTALPGITKGHYSVNLRETVCQIIQVWCILIWFLGFFISFSSTSLAQSYIPFKHK